MVLLRTNLLFVYHRTCFASIIRNWGFYNRNIINLTKAVCSFSVQISSNDTYDIPSVPATKVEYLQKLLLLQPQTPSDAKVLKVAVIGCPNSGKSTLVNMLTKWKVCAVAGKAHTTRSKQMAALMHENTQVVFVDLPGLVNQNKVRSFNLEKSFIRDPHAAIFDADLILVVVDVSHKYSRLELDNEIIKLLHFFDNKQSILILNKIDTMQKDQTRLLDITRKLTGGIVHGKRSTFDKYAARYERRAKMSPNSHQLIPPNEIISAHLPPVCHEVANKFLNYLTKLQCQLASGQFHSLSNGNKDYQEHLSSSPPPSIAESTAQGDFVNSYSNDNFLKDRELIPSDTEDINKFFATYVPTKFANKISTSLPNDDEFVNLVDDSPNDWEEKSPSDVTKSVTAIWETAPSDLADIANIDPMLEALENQLMLKSVNPVQVAERRKRWLEISRRVKGIQYWEKFNEVFMISSSNILGINRLRDYLISQALPNRMWLLPSNLVTDQEPSELVRMCVWAQCLDKLDDEIPYRLKIVVDDCDRIKAEDGDDRIYVHVRLQCQNERQMKIVLGPSGRTIKEIAASSKLELMTIFRSETVVKLSAEMGGIPKTIKKQLRKADDFSQVFPHFNEENEETGC